MAGNPFVAVQVQPKALYRFPDTSIMTWLSRTPGDSRVTQIREKIGQYPVALWVGPGSIGKWINGYAADAAKQNQLPVFVAYAIMSRDVGQWSSGGAKSLAEYLAWGTEFAKGIGTRPAVLIVEPDSLIHMPALTAPQQDLRLQALRGLLAAFAKDAPNTAVYLDAGDSHYNSPESVAPWLIKAGISGIRGFSANVANYNPTAEVRQFATKLISVLRAKGVTGDLGYVIDTARNGAGRPPESYIQAHPSDWWCNWPGTKIGTPPGVPLTGGAEDADLWVKHVGESDGGCGVAPSSASGEFLPALAFRQITGT